MDLKKVVKWPYGMSYDGYSVLLKGPGGSVRTSDEDDELDDEEQSAINLFAKLTSAKLVSTKSSQKMGYDYQTWKIGSETVYTTFDEDGVGLLSSTSRFPTKHFPKGLTATYIESATLKARIQETAELTVSQKSALKRGIEGLQEELRVLKLNLSNSKGFAGLKEDSPRVKSIRKAIADKTAKLKEKREKLKAK